MNPMGSGWLRRPTIKVPEVDADGPFAHTCLSVGFACFTSHTAHGFVYSWGLVYQVCARGSAWQPRPLQPRKDIWKVIWLSGIISILHFLNYRWSPLPHNTFHVIFCFPCNALEETYEYKHVNICAYRALNCDVLVT